MASSKKRRAGKARKSKLFRSRLAPLAAAALSIPGIGYQQSAQAQSAPESPMIKLFYADYEDYQPGEDRMRIKEPIVWARTPFLEKYQVEGSFTIDSLSGASPYYYNALTGASGLGVEDVRHAGDMKVTRYFEDFSIGIGGVISSEDDYESRGMHIESRIWTPDKNTTFAFGVGGHGDDLTSSIDDTFDESRTTFDFLIGVTQVINEVSIMQSNMTLSTADGYHADPYKPLDNRPQSRDQWAWLTRYNLYIPQLDASLHTDYRFYLDSWGIVSHMIELAWYQPLGENWLVRPNIRYYSQNEADFFTNTFPPEVPGEFLTADQRLSALGGITTGIKIIRELPKGFAVDAGFSYIAQDPDYKLGGNGSDVIESFHARYFTVGVSKKFE